jgi:hypothetical protein
MADFKISRIRFTWRGVWTTSTVYAKDDVINYGGKSYVCTSANTASANFYTDSANWTLWFDGYTWKGVWAVGTLYNIGDYVTYGGVIYICTAGHTSAATALLGLEANQANWIIYALADEWSKNWAASTRFKKGDIVRYGSTLYRCLTGHQTGATLEANQSNWAVVSYGSDWKTDWSTSVQYKVGDVVRYGGIVYKCVTGHTSNVSVSSGLEVDQSKWTIVHSGIDFKTNWASVTRYKLNDIVKYGADLWFCNIPHTSTTTFSTTNFSIYVPGLEFSSTWSVSASYVVGDVVVYGGYQYVSATTNNQGNIPSTDATDWTLLSKSYNIRGEYVASPTPGYKVGEIVRRDGQLYVAIADNTGNDPTDTSAWQLLIPGVQWRNTWALTTAYAPGDIVTYNGTAYVCKQLHNATTSNTPLIDNTFTSLMITGASGTGALTTRTGSITATSGVNVTVSSSTGLHIGETFVVAGTGAGALTAGTYYIGNIIDGTTIALASTYLGALGTADINFGTLTLSGTTFTATPTVTGVGTVTFPAQANSPYTPGNLIIVSNTTPTAYNGTYTVITCTNTTASFATLATGFTTGGSIQNASIYWDRYAAGDQWVAIQTYGDIPTYGTANKPIPIGTQGQLLRATAAVTNGVVDNTNIAPAWNNFGIIGAVYYVAMSGIDLPTRGTTVDTPWASIRYACANVIGPATIFIKTGTYTEILPISIPAGVALCGDELRGTVVQPAAGYEGSNMFLCRNGTGIRNMTLQGLTGGLTPINQYLTSRPTGGAFVSLDPGSGPNDTSVQITSKSPYAQNVTMFGTGCTGVKIDGTLHNGGNRSIVANDFTTVISDGIGAWCTGPSALTELVSVFNYYGHIGYLAEAGGRIRATNGNSSYGTYGTVAEGYDTTEVPLAATVNNRSQQAQIAAAFAGQANNKILRLEFSNAGQNYTTATYTFSGAGTGAVAIADEFRDGGIFEARISGPTDITAGGSGYLTAGNQAGGGTNTYVTLASNDQNLITNYFGMRLIVTSGTGVGQYGYIQYYNSSTKAAYISRESFPQVTVTATSNANNSVTCLSTSTLQVGQAIMFGPSTQTTSVTASSSVDNSLTLASVSGIFVGENITFAVNPTFNTIFGGVSPGTSYFVYAINGSKIQISTALPTTLGGTGTILNISTYAGTANMLATAQGVIGTLGWGTPYWVLTNNTVSNQITLSATAPGTFTGTSNSTQTISGIASTVGIIVGGAVTGPGIQAGTTVLGTGISTVTLSQSTLTSVTGTWTYAGVPVPVYTANGNSYIGAVGFDNILPGQPIAPALDTTTVYSIEPKVSFSSPGFTGTLQVLPSTSTWAAMIYALGTFVAIDQVSSVATSTDGKNWLAATVNPTALAAGTAWTSLAFGQGFFVAVAGGASSSNLTSISNTGASWSAGGTLPVAANWSACAFGNGTFVAIAYGSTYSATSTSGTSWANGGSLPTSRNWSSIAYGSIGTWVAVASGTANAAYSTNNGSLWTPCTLPASSTWISVTWGNGRFVAIDQTNQSAYSFDGITWTISALPSTQTWTAVTYGQGLFFAVAANTSTAATSQDGLYWTPQIMPTSAPWSAVAFGNPTSIAGAVTPIWTAIAGTASNTAASVLTGPTAIGRVIVANSKVSMVKIYEPGGGYATTPTVTIYDPNATLAVTTTCRTATGVLGNPTFLNRGNGYQTSTTTVAVNGDGYADQFQSSQYLYVSGLSQSPTPGAAMTISGNNNLYRVVVITPLGSGNYLFQIAAALTISLAPVHGTTISIRLKYSQCRITGHDFLYIGTGNKAQTNYPNVDPLNAASYKQIAENNSGRVFQTSTDQDGNFKVGNLFAVQQASGIVTISANQFSLAGLTKLVIGGLSAGANSVTITSFSTDTYFVANSDTVVPTQKAVKAYLARNIAGGGSNAQTGAVIAGTVGLGGSQKIYSSVGQQILMKATVNIKGPNAGINGMMLAHSLFANSFGANN